MNQDTPPFPVHEGMLTLNLVRETEGENPGHCIAVGAAARSGAQSRTRVPSISVPPAMFSGVRNLGREWERWDNVIYLF